MHVSVLAGLRAGLSFFWRNMVWVFGVFLAGWVVGTGADVIATTAYFYATSMHLKYWMHEVIWALVAWTLIDFRLVRAAVEAPLRPALLDERFWAAVPTLLALATFAIVLGQITEETEAALAQQVNLLALGGEGRINETAIDSWWFRSAHFGVAVIGHLLRGLLILPYFALLSNVAAAKPVLDQTGWRFVRANWLSVMLAVACLSFGLHAVGNLFYVGPVMLGIWPIDFGIITDWRDLVGPTILRHIAELPAMFFWTVLPVILTASIYRLWIGAGSLDAGSSAPTASA